MKLTDEYYSAERLAIMQKWHRIVGDSGTRPSVIAERYRLLINPDLWERLVYGIGLAYNVDETLRGVTKFLDLAVILDNRIEGWLILPLSEVVAQSRQNN